MTDVALPKPEIRGVGHVLYRCAECGEQMEPEAAVIVAGKSYHAAHAAHEPEHESNGL